MRILQVGLSYNPGGIESFVMNYYRELVKQDVQFDFISMFPKLAYEDEITSLGGKVYHTVDGRKHPLAFYRQMKKILRMRRYDAVHVNMLSAANIVPVMVARQLGVRKVIAHSHNSSTPGVIRNFLHRMNKPFLSRFATDYFACSHVAAEWLFTKKVLKKENVRVIHNALKMEKFLCTDAEREKIRQELQLEDKYVVGHVGRFEEQKNHLFLIEIFKALVKTQENAVLLLVGNGELEAQVREKVHEYGLDKNVMFLGLRDDVPRILKAMDLFLFPSLFEGLPLVLLEAQAAGVRCVVSSSVTKDVDITGQMEFISLDEEPMQWAKLISNRVEMQADALSTDVIQTRFQDAGYEICAAANQLKLYYSEDKKIVDKR